MNDLRLSRELRDELVEFLEVDPKRDDLAAWMCRVFSTHLTTLSEVLATTGEEVPCDG